jgi:hypothetical protein
MWQMQVPCKLDAHEEGTDGLTVLKGDTVFGRSSQ